MACLTEAFRQAGHEAHLAVLRPAGAYEARLRAAGVVLHVLRHAGHHDPRIHTQLAALARRLRPAVVQTWLPLMDIAGGLAALRAGVPWVLSERNSAPGYPPTLKNRARRWLGRRAAAVVANSTAGLDYWRHTGSEPCTLRLIPNAIARAAIDAAPPVDLAAEGVAAGRPVLLYVGRLEESKNLALLVEALAQPALLGRVTAVCCGEGPARGAIEALAAERGVAADLRLLGKRDDVWSWMKRAAVFTSPSRHEGMPNAVVEAMTSGCPIVVSDIPSHREILDTVSARFVSPDDPAALAAAVAGLLANRPQAEALGQAARARAAQWSVEASMEAYLALYRELAPGAAR